MLSVKSEKPRYTPRQDADRELPILITPLYLKKYRKGNDFFSMDPFRIN